MKYSVIAPALLLLLATVHAFGQGGSTTADDSGSREMIIRVKGSKAGESVFTLEVEPGKPATRAIRIYSEPSHQLLALIIDREFKSSPEGVAWKAATTASGEAQATITTMLPEGQPVLHMRPRPADDTRIQVWIFGTWPDGATEDRLIADALVGARAFGFSGFITTPLTPGSGKEMIEIEWCCESAECEEICKECTGFRFTCCVVGEPDCCWIECGHVPACTCHCDWSGHCEA